MKTVELSPHLFHWPTTISVSGATSSGKTEWVKKLIQHREFLFGMVPEKIIYFYGIWQEGFKDMSDVIFVEGLPKDIESYANRDSSALWIIDDLMAEVRNNREAELLFTRGSHHLNLTVVYINQNVCCQGKSTKTISLNTHVNVLFRNPRDVMQIARMDSQMGMGGLLKEAYADVTQQPFSYLVVDLSPFNHSEIKLSTKIFPGENRIVFMK